MMYRKEVSVICLSWLTHARENTDLDMIKGPPLFVANMSRQSGKSAIFMHSAIQVNPLGAFS
jgi:hypothetical protein